MTETKEKESNRNEALADNASTTIGIYIKRGVPFCIRRTNSWNPAKVRETGNTKENPAVDSVRIIE